ncbi:MAG: ribosomal L7Ae/L30e/S12e/Gadd45 family protein [Gemmatimonadota bacterium]|jgi:ribosomal protein L30E
MKKTVDRVGPTLKPRFNGLVRQARRSGRIVIGVQQTRAAAKAGRAAATLVADDLSPRRREALVDRLDETGVAMYDGWNKDELGEIAGRAAVAALTITDRHIASGLSGLVASQTLDPQKERGRG